MRLPPAPIRFLLLVVGGWVAIRAATLLPAWTTLEDAALVGEASPPPPATAPRERADSQAMAPGAPVSDGIEAPPPVWAASRADATRIGRLALVRPVPPGTGVRMSTARAPVPASPVPGASSAPSTARFPLSPPIASLQPPALSGRPAMLGAQTAIGPASRLAGHAWLFARNRGGGGLAPGGTLGGSQAGARLTYRLNRDARRPVSLSGRLYTPFDRPEGSEVAVGIDWRPIAGLPLNLLAEHRQRLGRDGRSDFALTLYGGTETRFLRDRVRIEAYGQAGIVGVEEGDLFADGSIVATTRIGPIDAGGGAWGGAQPGVSRLDLGPHASFRLPVGRTSIRAAAEWRFRVAGEAAPSSGPVITISAGF